MGGGENGTNVENTSHDGLEEDEYPLNRDWLASSRLTLQHFLVRLRTTWLLHPKISESTASTVPLHIADVCAGNCAWSLDFLSSSPSTEITAFDVSRAQYPFEDTASPNLHLETWDIFTPPPAKYYNTFDIVHIAFAIALFPNGGEDVVIKHLFQLLKPGGWIQWMDVAPPGVTPVDTQTLEPVAKADWPAVTKTLSSKFGGIFDKMEWLNGIDQLLTDAGCEKTEIYRCPVRRELLKLEYDGIRLLYDEFLGVLYRRMKGNQEAEREFREIERDVHREWAAVEKGQSCWAYKIVVAIGQKPIESR